MTSRQNELLQHYEKLFEDEDLHYYPLDMTRRFLRTICRKSGVPSGGRVLDVGCATGYYSGIFHELGYQVTGVDFSPTAIGKARSYYAEVCFEVQDAWALDFGDKRFDLVFLSGCSILNTTDIDDIRKLITLLMKLVAPGGTLALINGTTLDGVHTSETTWISHTWQDINRYIPAGTGRVRGPWLSHFRLIAALPSKTLSLLLLNPVTTLLLRVVPLRLQRMMIYFIDK